MLWAGSSACPPSAYLSLPPGPRVTPTDPDTPVTIDSAIQNVGEYYAAHYLAEQFPKDIADQLKTWKGQSQPSQSPPRRLQALGDA